MDAAIDRDLKKKQERLFKALSQGEKINNLTAAPEWEFFEGWLQASKDKLLKQITSKAFVNDHNGYLFAASAITTIDMIFDGINGFKNVYKRAEKELNELEKMQ